MLKNIQRRKSPHSQQIGSLIGPSTGGEKFGIEDEIGRLKKERTMLMKEVIELQQQQKGTAQHVNTVNRRLQSAEQRQRQMISFLAKLLRNPEFLFCLRRKKEQKAMDSPRMKRKFVKQPKHEANDFTPSMDGQVVKYQPDWESLAIPSTALDLNPSLLPESMPNFQSENASLNDVIAPEELAFPHGIVKPTEELRVEVSNMTMEDRHFKGKAIGSPLEEFNPNYFVSLAEDLLQFSHYETESIIKPEEVWSRDWNVDAGTSSSNTELWSNHVSYEDPFLQVSHGLSPMWDLGSLQAGDLVMDKWPASGFPFDDSNSQAYPKNADDSEDKQSD